MNTKQIQIVLVEGQVSDQCEPYKILSKLIESHRLKNVYEVVPDNAEGGNCHDVAMAFMVDMIMACETKGWYWVKGLVGDHKSVKSEHSWIEHTDYVIELSNYLFDHRKIFIMEKKYYYSTKKPSRLQKRNCKSTKRLINKMSAQYSK
jgi:hypothetical protein